MDGHGQPREALICRLRLAYAGELGAARGYAGHWRSIRRPRRAGQRVAVRRIMREELEHRAHVGQMLAELGRRPSRLRDAWMWCIGTAIAASCFVGGWYLPMYGAGRIERRNIWEYEHAARLAAQAGLHRYVEGLLAMAEVEWDHERYFHDQVRGHWLPQRLGSWPEPGPREGIRASFDQGLPAPRPFGRATATTGA
ncbi:MAG TPA: demethoxyubiquinone hydroxylase family protein [Candidatus Thermoplasmatota archaeon]|nr:demethoxyubiquinone hydroxylase family protein [Candidatus Thermoplasmatota archaeon]